MANPKQDARGNYNGRYVRTLETIERDAEAARLYGRGLSYREVGEQLGISKRAAISAVKRAAREILRGPANEVLALHISRLEWAYGKAVEIAEAEHLVVSHGKVICDAEGNPLRDHAPILAALREARATLESFRALTGINQPVKIDATVTEVTQQDVELQEMLHEAKAKMQAEEQRIIDGGDE